MGLRKVAYLDYDEIYLYLENEDGDILEDIPWPEHWNERVSAEFVESEGFEIEYV